MFKIGDIVTGLPNNGYGITTDVATMQVLGVNDINIEVEILNHPEEEYIGETHHVRAIHFVLVKKTKPAPPPTPINLSQWSKAFKEWEGADKSGTATFMILRKHGGYRIRTAQPCHASLRSEKVGVLYIVTAVKTGYGKSREDKAYIKWLISSSPYSHFILNNTVPDVMKRGLITSTNVPSNLMMQAITALRQMWEYDYIVRAWYLLQGRGKIDKTLAFPLAHMMCRAVSGWRMGSNNSGHQAMGSAYIDLQFLKNYTTGKPSNTNPHYVEDCNYYGVHSLWNGTKERETYREEDVKLLPYLFTNKVEKDIWGDEVEYATDAFMLMQMKQVAKQLTEDLRYVK